MVISIIANAMVTSQFVTLSNAIGRFSMFCIAAIAVPMIASIELSLKMGSGTPKPQKKRIEKSRYIYPMAYITLLASMLFIFGRSPLYRIYFLGEGNAHMQILMIIAFACLFFIPLYEKNAL